MSQSDQASSEPAFDDVGAYDYELPRDLIAQHPLEHRIDARLMVVDRASGSWEHRYVRDLPELLQPGDALVLNDSKVIAARLLGSRTSTGGRWEGLFLRAGEDGVWEILSKTRGSLQPGESLSLVDKEGRSVEALTVLAKLEGGHLAVRPSATVLNSEEAESQGGLTVMQVVDEFLERFGRVPLPPYIRDGQMVDDDKKSYQTVFAKHPGSIAAPTAGLHFTADLLRGLQAKGVITAAVTLHVGLGTFRPVATEKLSDHQMHTEWAELPEKACEKLQVARREQGRVVAVGTTSMRTLESAALHTQQPLTPWKGETDIFIRPPFDFGAVDVLMTNFHLPKSTLIALVAAFAGYDLIMAAYAEAVRERYRFFSYGDCMLIV